MVSEKPWIGPIPAANSASMASPVTKLASRMVASEPAKPRRTAWLKSWLRANCSRTRSKQMMLASAAMPMPSTKATTADSDKVAWAALNTINSSHRYTTVDSAAIKPRARYRPISSAKMQAMPISPAITVSVRAVRPSTLPTVWVYFSVSLSGRPCGLPSWERDSSAEVRPASFRRIWLAPSSWISGSDMPIPSARLRRISMVVRRSCWLMLVVPAKGSST